MHEAAWLSACHATARNPECLDGSAVQITCRRGRAGSNDQYNSHSYPPHFFLVPHLFVVRVLPVSQPQFVQSCVPCVLSPVSGEIWQGHRLHRQLQLPAQVMLSLSTVCAKCHSGCGNGIATVGYRHDETQSHHLPVIRRSRFRPFKRTFSICNQFARYKHPMTSPTKAKTPARTQGFFQLQW